LKKEHLPEVAKLLLEDEGLGGHYEYLSLLAQLSERYDSSMGRHKAYLVDSTIVSHVATYAETEKLAVTSAVYTSPAYRNKGLMCNVYSCLCDELIKESKEVFAYYYTDAAIALHEKVGFKNIAVWGKLTRAI
jgi:predicted GNAT family acetyltransferase